jgi:hypothetical protein
MHRTAPVLLSMLLLLLVAGCASRPIERDNIECSMFGPQRMRIHPIFTQLKSFQPGAGADARPEGIEAEIEFQDQFGDPTKAAGKIMFELYGYLQARPDPRTDRLMNPWVGSLLTLQDQREHWNRTSRTYTFQLQVPGISPRRDYVLTAMFEHSDGRRFFSKLILKAVPEAVKNPTTLPSMPEPAPLPPATQPVPQPAPLPPAGSPQ